jgi:hypothetical protein
MPETLEDIERKIAELEKKIKAIEDIPEGQRTERQEARLDTYNQKEVLFCEKEKELRLIEGAAPAAAPAAVWYLSETTIRSLHKFGLRGSVYDLAGMKGAFHSNHQKTSIAYENPQLLAVRVLFSQGAHKSVCTSEQAPEPRGRLVF